MVGCDSFRVKLDICGRVAANLGRVVAANLVSSDQNIMYRV